jgi:hypothetical protein
LRGAICPLDSSLADTGSSAKLVEPSTPTLRMSRVSGEQTSRASSPLTETSQLDPEIL